MRHDQDDRWFDKRTQNASFTSGLATIQLEKAGPSARPSSPSADEPEAKQAKKAVTIKDEAEVLPLNEPGSSSGGPAPPQDGKSNIDAASEDAEVVDNAEVEGEPEPTHDSAAQQENLEAAYTDVEDKKNEDKDNKQEEDEG